MAKMAHLEHMEDGTFVLFDYKKRDPLSGNARAVRFVYDPDEKRMTKVEEWLLYTGRNFSELKIPYNTVVVVDFADLECEASAKSVTVCAARTVTQNDGP